MMTRRLLGDLRFEKFARRPHLLGRERAAHRLEQALRTDQQPRFDHGRRDADVGRAFALTVVDCADAVPDLEPDVPHESEEALEIRLPGRRLAFRQQNHDVDVGTEIQLAATVAADRDQGDIANVFTDLHRPRGAEEGVDQPCAVAHQAFDRFVVEKALFEAGVAFGERGAVRRDVQTAGGELRLQVLRDSPNPGRSP